MMIHYFLDGNPNYSYVDSWEKHMGHVEIKKWDSSMLPYEEYPTLKIYRDRGKWSILSDFLRNWAVWKFGGIYLDIDVELIKPIDHFFNYECFVCVEGEPILANMAVSGGKAGNKHHEESLKWYLEVIEGKRIYPAQLEVACSPHVVTDYISHLKGERIGHKELNEICEYDGLTTIPKRFFYPYNWNEQFDHSVITEDTYGIHWWKMGWANL